MTIKLLLPSIASVRIGNCVVPNIISSSFSSKVSVCPFIDMELFNSDTNKAWTNDELVAILEGSDDEAEDIDAVYIPKVR